MASKKEENSDKKWVNYFVVGLLLVIAVVFSFVKLSNVGFAIYSPSSNTNSTSEWLMFQRGLGHTGWDGVDVPYMKGYNFLNYSTGAVYSSPVIVNGYVYVSNSNNVTYKLKASNVSDQVSNVTTQGYLFKSSPVVVNSSLYLATNAGILYQINVSNMSQQTGIYTTGIPMESSPSIAGGYVYLSNNNLYQLNASNISQQISMFGSSEINYSVPAIAKGYVYVGGFNGLLYQLNASNVSKMVFSYVTEGNITSSPAVSDDYVYITSGNTTYQLNASNVSELVSSYAINGSFSSSPAVSGNYVYVAGGNTTYQLNASNVSELVSSYAINGSFSSSPVVYKSYVYIISGTNGTLYQLNAGNISLNSTSFSSGSLSSSSSPAVSNSYIYMTSGDSTYQLNAENVSFPNDFTAPNISITFPKNWSNYTSSDTNKISYTASDNVGISSCWFSTDGGASNTTVACGSSVTGLQGTEGVNKWIIYVEDASGNMNSSEVVFTVPSTQTSNSTTTNTTTSSTTLQSSNNTLQPANLSSLTSPASNNVGSTESLYLIKKDSPVLVNVTDKGNADLTELILTASQNVSSATLTVLKISSISLSELGVSSGSVYQSFNINSTGVNDTNLKNVTFKFRVNATWLNSNGLDPSKVVLYRKVNGSWVALSTNLTKIDSKYYYFTAVSPGFSTYSVFAGKSQCSVGQVRCLGNEAQTCASANNWTSAESCQFGCSAGKCISQSSSKSIFLAIVPAFVHSTVGYILYYFILLVLLVGIFLFIAFIAENDLMKVFFVKVKKMSGKLFKKKKKGMVMEEL